MPIIISKNGQNAKKIDKSNFQKEDYLQEYIQNNPDSIPIYELKEDKRLFIVKREFSTNAGPIDALAVDKDGEIYIIETKLYKNPDKRTVVAQALDYGAALWKHMNDFQEFISILDKETKVKFNMSFDEKVKDFFNLSDEEIELTKEAIKNNLNEGNIKFVVLMDSIDERLKDLILYVNQNSQFDIYAVQLEYYKFEDYEIMIPKIFGVEVKKNIRTNSYNQRKKWDESQFITQTKEYMQKNADKLIKLYQYFKNNADTINWGTGAINGSFAPIFNKIDKKTSPFSFYSNGDILIKFGWLLEHSTKEIVEQHARIFIDECNKNTTFKIPENYLQVTFKISSQEFIDNYDGIIRAIKKLVEHD
jgi:hypothetical protein